MSGEGIGEFELIARIFAPLAHDGAFGLLDDAAVLRPRPGMDLVLTKDAVVSGVHFFPDDPWDSVAQKALRVNLSDLAAKGAAPVGYLLALGLPKDFTVDQIDALGRGLATDQGLYGITLFGGDTVRSAGGLTLSVTAIGEVEAGCMVRRGGARAGDLLVVTGSIGDAALGLKLRLDPGLAGGLGLDTASEAYLLDRYLLPRPRNAVASVLAKAASGAMDISDGLIGDITKMAAASGVAVEIDLPKVPLSPAAKAAVAARPALLATVVTGGDDYEIALSLPPERLANFSRATAERGVPVTVIGRFSAGSGVTLAGSEVDAALIGNGSYRHF